jgi:Glycosyl transferases group 1
MASGRPVIAFGRGGLTETVAEGVTGLFFHEQTAAALIEAIRDFEHMQFDPRAIRAQAEKFSAQRFAAEFTAAVETATGRKLGSLRRAGLPREPAPRPIRTVFQRLVRRGWKDQPADKAPRPQ